jgi:hypothetical protein
VIWPFGDLYRELKAAREIARQAQADSEQACDASTYYAQEASELKDRIRKMVITRGGVDTVALEIAQRIEDLFAQHHPGGVVQRRAKAQVLIGNAIREALTGTKQ